MRFVVPARIAVDAPDASEAVAKARLLVQATDRLRDRGYDLSIDGAAVPDTTRRASVDVDRCESCGGSRHDGAPCISESGAAF